MIDINTYYLIDYENVGNDGLSNCNKLDETDHIHIFYTGDTARINLDILNNHGGAELKTHKVPQGNQSVDMHLVSFLGYLVGINKGNGCAYVIISNDNDYDNVVKFWADETKDRIVKAARINPPAVKQKNAIVQMPVKNTANTAAANQAAKSNPSADSQPKKQKGTNKTKLNQEVQRELSQKGYGSAEINGVAKLVCKYYGQDDFLGSVHNELRKKYDDYLEVYRDIKPVIKKYGT